MDFRKILNALWILLLACVASSAHGVDGNALGGSAYSDTPGGGPLGGVQVNVAQDSKIVDQTRSEDGVYTLKVPLNVKQFDLLYQKAGYLDSHDFNITNSQDQQKRPVARMTPKSSIGALPHEKLQTLVDTSIAAMRRGRTADIPPLQRSGRSNLETLQENIKPSTPALTELRVKIKQALTE